MILQLSFKSLNEILTNNLTDFLYLSSIGYIDELERRSIARSNWFSRVSSKCNEPSKKKFYPESDLSRIKTAMAGYVKTDR